MIPALILSLTIGTTPYCAGWQEGFKQGWCYDYQVCFATPPAPPCPIPKAGKSTREDGYNDGFVKGRAEAEKLNKKSPTKRP